MKQRKVPYPQQGQYQPIAIPRNSALGPVLGLAGAALGFGLVWYIGWLALSGFTAILISVILRSFVRDTVRLLPATEVAQHEARWHARIAHARPASRDQEQHPANMGLAELPS